MALHLLFRFVEEIHFTNNLWGKLPVYFLVLFVDCTAQPKHLSSVITKRMYALETCLNGYFLDDMPYWEILMFFL